MAARIALLVACLLYSAAAATETVYKYRRPDGRTVYSNRPVPGLELIETFEYRFPAPAAAAGKSSQSDAEAEARIRARLDELQAAWTEVQDANRELAAAQEALGRGAEPEPGDRAGVASGAASPAAGGVPAAASPAIGGAMSGRRGRPSPEYVARMQALEGAVAAARSRLDAALRRYNQLR